MSRSSHRRRRSNSKLARYSYIRHATRLEIYDVPISGAFLLPDAGNAWHGARSSLPQPDLWARWVTVHDVPGILAMGPAAIKRSRMKSRRWWSNPIDYRRIMATSLELRRREEPWHREDRDYLGRGGVRSCALDEDLDDPRDEWGHELAQVVRDITALELLQIELTDRKMRLGVCEALQVAHDAIVRLAQHGIKARIAFEGSE